MGKQAFNGKRGQHFFCDPNRVSIVGLFGKEGSGNLDTPHKDGTHPLWDARVDLPVDPALVANIRQYGVIESVKVRKNGKYPEGHPLAGEDIIEVIDGRQRTRACRVAHALSLAAGEIPAQLKIEIKKEDEGSLLGIMVSANEQRRNDSVVEKARKASRILALGHPLEMVSNMFGVHKNTIRSWAKFMELSPKVHKAVASDQLTFTDAMTLHGLSAEEQVTQLATAVETMPAPATTTAPAKPRKASLNFLSKSRVKKLVGDEDFMSGLSNDARAILRLITGDHSAMEDIPGFAKQAEV